MKVRWSIKTLSEAVKFRGVGLLGFAALVAVAPLSAAHAQGVARVGRVSTVPADTAARENVVPNAPLLDLNAANLSVAVLDKTLHLSAEQKAAIGDLQTALQAERRAVDALRVAPPQQAVVVTNGDQNPTNAANPTSTGEAAQRDVRLAESAAVSAAAQAASAQREDFFRLQNAEQSLARNEQTTVRKIRALLTTEQIAQLKTTESDALLFDSVGLPSELLGQIALTPDERANITTIFKTARRQFQRATRQSDRDAIQNDARAQSLAALAPQNKSIADAYLKTHPAATETQ